MNPISALIFIIFLGGAGLSYLAQMPLAVTIVLALVGILPGLFDWKAMAQQWERAVVLRLEQAAGRQGAGPLHPGADHRPGGDVDRPAHSHHRSQCRTGA